MSKYTTEVRFICETYAGMTENKGVADVKSILTTSAPKVFDFDFPIFDEQYRLPLETKILRHYYTREISEETVGLWNLRLEDKMNLIMPYYNQLYESELLKFNPLYDVDLIRDHKRENEGETNSTENRTNHVDNSQDSTGTRNDAIHNERNETTDTTTKSTTKGTTDTTVDTTVDGTDNSTVESTENVKQNGSGWNLYSDTPQGGVGGIENATKDVANLAYLTNATHTTNESTTNTTGNETTNRTTKDTTKGSTNATNDETVDGTGKSTINGNEDETINVKTTNNLTGTTNGTEDVTGKNTITSTEDYIEHVRGKQGTASYSKMLTEFRETFLNIDAMVVDELNDLFFGLW